MSGSGKIATKTTQYFRKWKIFIARLQIKTRHIRKIYFVTCVHDVMENMVDRSSASAPPSQCQSNTSAQSWILFLCELECLLFIQVTVMTWDMKAFSLLFCWTSYLRRVFQRSRLPSQNTFLDIESWKRKLSQESVQSITKDTFTACIGITIHPWFRSNNELLLRLNRPQLVC